MKAEFCCICGEVHETGSECAEFVKASARVTRRTASNMPKGVKDEKVEQGPALGESISDRRKETEKEIAELQQEEELAILEKKLAKLRRRKELREKEGDTEIQDGAVAILKDKPFTGIHQDSDSDDEGEDEKVGTCTSHCRERRKLREPRRRRRNSSSSSRSSSRRRRGKWSLKRFTLAKKDVTKLNCYELICATTAWVLKVTDLSLKDSKAMFEHLNFLSYRAMHGEYVDGAHIAYDVDVRKTAEEIGFAAFARKNQGGSVLHYSPENMRGFKKGTTKPTFAKRQTVVSQAKGACYAWNGEQGCSRTDDECKFGHVCSRCGLRGHKRTKCKD